METREQRKRKKDHWVLSPDTKGKVQSTKTKERTGETKNAAWPGIVIKSEKRRWKPVLLILRGQKESARPSADKGIRG